MLPLLSFVVTSLLMSSLSDVSFYVWNLLTSMLWPSWFTVVCVALLISLLYPTIVCFLCAYMYMYAHRKQTMVGYNKLMSRATHTTVNQDGHSIEVSRFHT